MTPDDRRTKLQALTRPGGGFAMVANDGRESLRGILHQAGRPSEDADVVAFKTTVARELGPYCTAMLFDPMYGLPALAALREVAPQTGRLLAVDRFDEPRFGPLAATSLDREAMRPDNVPGDVHALKFYMFWHPDRPAGPRREQAAEFVEGCARLGVLSLLEGVVQLAGTDPRFDDALLAAATELGGSRPDVYKAQVPTLGRAPLEDVERMSGDLSRAVGTPWVALSNGVPSDRFADVVGAVCRGGASGFLAGRASWSRAVEHDDPATELASSGVLRLQTLVERVDRDAVPWWAAAGVAAPRQAVQGVGLTR